MNGIIVEVKLSLAPIITRADTGYTIDCPLVLQNDRDVVKYGNKNILNKGN